jgi:hypothetical protein
MEQAIRNMTAKKYKKPVDPELTGSGRKAELASISRILRWPARTLIVERQKLVRDW